RTGAFYLVPQQLVGVDHDVADQVDLVFGYTLAQQILICVGRRRPEYVGNGVCDESVDFLGHSPVTTSQTGFEVDDRDPQLGANHGARGGGIDVANYDDPVRSLLHADLFISDHNAAGLFSMGAAAHAEVKLGWREGEIPEEGIRHVEVVM